MTVRYDASGTYFGFGQVNWGILTAGHPRVLDAYDAMPSR
jgi:hypothetical protein